jgi:dCMP deaminase
MKRRVGAVLVRENRIVSTGYVTETSNAFSTAVYEPKLRYNGTPRWLTNCNMGGCGICNGTLLPDENRECICLHAEENAILEAGRERVGVGAVLYCNTWVRYTSL